jgi:hypothetical protein
MVMVVGGYMSGSTYFRGICLCGMFISCTVLILDIAMCAATWADCSMGLGWDWDCHISRHIPFFIGAASLGMFLVARFLRTAILRWSSDQP